MVQHCWPNRATRRFGGNDQQNVFELARSQGANVDWRESARWVDAGHTSLHQAYRQAPMALAVIQRIFGAELAEVVMNYTEYQWHRDADHDPFAQLLNQGALPG